MKTLQRAGIGRFTAASIIAVLAMPSTGHTQTAPPRASVTAKNAMIVSAHRDASEAAARMLDAGGNAVDAMIAAQLVLGLVEPQSSGLGGGAFAVLWDQKTGAMTTFDARETAPAVAKPAMFTQTDGSPVTFMPAVLGGTSTGVPGVPMLLDELRRTRARLPWSTLIEPAVTLADNGFVVSPRLASLLKQEPAQRFDAASRAYFFDAQGAPRTAGTLMKNPDYAKSLRTLAAEGAAPFYRGPLATEMVRAVTSAPTEPSGMVAADFAAYRVVERPAVCVPYRQHQVCSMGPPASGVALGQTLMLLDKFNLGIVPLAPSALHLIAEAEKLAFADRDRLVADPRAVPQPHYVDPAYMAARGSLIDPQRAMGRVQAGTPPGMLGKRSGLDTHMGVPGTTHVSIIDAEGNAVALTSSVASVFGSHRFVGGFLLNSQLTDFGFRYLDDSGAEIANAAGPGKRPRSAMVPTIVRGADGRVVSVLGSAGGTHMILHVVKALVAAIDWKLDAQAAVDLPNFGSRNGPFELDASHVEQLGPALTALGHTVKPMDAPSSLHMILRRPDGQLAGGADFRREGAVVGR